MITQKELKKIFNYKEGYLYWGISQGSIKKGRSAGCMDGGYLRVTVNGERYSVHRLIFLMHHGYLPKYLDHIDNNSSNNKITNLRECTISQNAFNSKISTKNTSGAKGVVWEPVRKKWRATIMNKGKSVFLGRFNDKDVAAQIIRIERLKLHREFANYG